MGRNYKQYHIKIDAILRRLDGGQPSDAELERIESDLDGLAASYQTDEALGMNRYKLYAAQASIEYYRGNDQRARSFMEEAVRIKGTSFAFAEEFLGQLPPPKNQRLTALDRFSAWQVLPVGIAIVIILIYLYTAAPFMLWEDAPRFAAAIATLGIGDPAEPVYVFLAHFFTYLPFGSIIFRIQIFSALLAGAALLLLYMLVIRILKLPNLPEKTRNQSNQQHDLPNQGIVILAGIFSMLVLAFSYEFWSQAQNIETFILDCLLELIVLLILLGNISHKTVFSALTIVVILCGVATGTDPPVIASVFPLVLSIAWRWREALGIKRLALLFFFGVGGIAMAWSLLAIMELHNPLLNEANGLSLSGIWSVATGQGKNVSAPGLGLQNGLTWSLTIILQDAWRYLVTLWMSFTPLLLPVILTGAYYLWRNQRRIFYLLLIVVITNFVLCSLYRTGNEETWTLQSDVVFALFAGAGFFWLTRILATKWLGVNIRLKYAAVFLFACIPLVYWWPALDRHAWNFTQDYIVNLYQQLKGPAIFIGSGDLWDAASSYVYDATDYKSDVVPVLASYFYAYDWRRHVLVQRSHVKIPDTSRLTHRNPAEYSKFMNDFFALNLPKFRIYVNQEALRDRYFEGADEPSLQIDLNRFTIVPRGMVEEIVSKDEHPDINLNSFTYHFGNGFPKKRPYFLERTSSQEMQGIIDEIALSYDAAAVQLTDSNQFAGAISFYQKALTLAPKDAQILSDMGVSYGRQGQSTTALYYLKKAHDLAPDNLWWFYDLANAEGLAGKIDAERQDLQSIISKTRPDSDLAQLASEKLNSLNRQSPTQ